MKAEERERLIREKGREEGREERREQMSKLVHVLLEEKRYDDAKLAMEDEAYYQQLCKEYDI